MKAIIFSLFLSHFQPKEQTIIFNLRNFEWIAYDYDGNKIKSGLASGGRKFCKDIQRGCKTPYGFFYVINKRGKNYRSPLYPIDKKIKSPMAYSCRFKWTGESTHASSGDDWENPIHRSHGCIHLKNDDARWVNFFSSSLTKFIVLPY